MHPFYLPKGLFWNIPPAGSMITDSMTSPTFQRIRTSSELHKKMHSALGQSEILRGRKRKAAKVLDMDDSDDSNGSSTRRRHRNTHALSTVREASDEDQYAGEDEGGEDEEGGENEGIIIIGV